MTARPRCICAADNSGRTCFTRWSAENGTVYAATTVRWEDSTSVYATFNLTGAASGLYDVRVSNPAGGSKTLPDALQISAGTGPILVTEITVPGAVRVGPRFLRADPL